LPKLRSSNIIVAQFGGAAGEGAPFEDLDMVPPGLDELYAHFLAGRASK